MHVAQQPAAAGRLAAALDTLHKHQVRRGGRLAAVRTKNQVSRGEAPDAG